MEKIINLYVMSHCKIDTNKFKDREILYCAKNIKKDTFNGIETWNKTNIDNKNKFYCELTMLYWVWKNVNNCEYVSFEHYRRVFIKNGFNKFKYKLVDKRFIKKKLEKYDLILPRKHHFKKNLYDQYFDNHYIEDINLMRNIISLKYKEYLDTFDLYFSNHNSCLFNMCIMKKSDFDNYCEFAFSILDEVFENIKFSIEERDSYQQRAIGFLAERLFNVWINYNFSNKKIYYCSVGHLNQNCFIHNLKNLIFRFLNRDYDI